MVRSLTYGDMDEFMEVYELLVLRSTNYHDSKENAYHMLLLGMLMNLQELYEITSNIEAGHGRNRQSQLLCEE